MKRSIKMLSVALIPTLVLVAGSVAAQSVQEAVKAMTQEKATAGEQLQNLGEQDQLRQRLNENDPENAKKVRAEKNSQEGKKSQHKYQYKEKAPGSHMHQSGGGFGSGMGGGKGGGGRR